MLNDMLGQTNPYNSTLEAGLQSSNKEPIYAMSPPPLNSMGRTSIYTKFNNSNESSFLTWKINLT